MSFYCVYASSEKYSKVLIIPSAQYLGFDNENLIYKHQGRIILIDEKYSYKKSKNVVYIQAGEWQKATKSKLNFKKCKINKDPAYNMNDNSGSSYLQNSNIDCKDFKIPTIKLKQAIICKNKFSDCKFYQE